MADRISSCPDSILCYILSFLPTKQVVATRFLSKRWKHLWRSVPSLDFDFRNCFFASPLFSVYYLLNFREIYQPLHRLRFTCSNFFDFDGVDRCIETALRRSGRLEHLDINLEWTVYLPFAVFFCQTLVVLKLAIITPNFFPFVDLPLLKILHLKSARFFKCEDLQRFLSGCPNIEDLEVGSGLTRKPAANSAVKFQKLPKLIRANIHTHLIPLEFVKNVEVLVTDRIYKDDLVFDLHNLLQLELTRFNLKCSDILQQFLSGCPNLEDLEVMDMIVKNLGSNTAEKFNTLPKLIRAKIDSPLVALEIVKNVEVLVTDCVMRNLVQLEVSFVLLSMNWFWVLEVLKHCPKLQVLVIKRPQYQYSVYGVEKTVLSYPHPVPTCISFHLKTCCLQDYIGSSVEFQFAKYIMQNAKYLRTMKFCFDRYNETYNPLRRDDI
ncbi:F-box/FBD/LRR-repeat protein At5g22660-like [Phaseolus vulgaris]|uniref:F-box/FBD/LRR-repeat protein At5g22660-like n=1 Tax=Phaseolus vulgaris TaxID=3885 RepID=UPI0035CC0C9C